MHRSVEDREASRRKQSVTGAPARAQAERSLISRLRRAEGTSAAAKVILTVAASVTVLLAGDDHSSKPTPVCTGSLARAAEAPARLRGGEVRGATSSVPRIANHQSAIGDRQLPIGPTLRRSIPVHLTSPTLRLQQEIGHPPSEPASSEPASAGSCDRDLQCDDCNPCTRDACIAGTCSNVAWPDVVTCHDGLFCNGVETCQGGVCTSAVSETCPEQVCDEAGDACVDACLSDIQCNDGLVCSGVESCRSGVCVPGENPCGLDAACEVDQVPLGFCVGGVSRHEALLNPSGGTDAQWYSVRPTSSNRRTARFPSFIAQRRARL